ncbi:MAG: hypothetical protein PHH11_11645, partial [Methylomonas sp.]|nr:hypothetical protein [Methylomonas sp.]
RKVGTRGTIQTEAKITWGSQMFRKNAKQKTAEGRVFSPYTAPSIEEPIGWPAGRKPWMVFVKALESGGIGAALWFLSLRLQGCTR